MFGFFKKTAEQIPSKVSIWITETARNEACLNYAKSHKTTIFLAWFEETRAHFKEFAAAKGVVDLDIRLVQQSFPVSPTNDMIFLEHHPLQSEEQANFKRLAVDQAVIYTSLEEPIFGIFGGEKIIALAKRMGMEEDDVIEHKTINASIKKAQEKIAAKAIILGTARSQSDWLLNAGIMNNGI